MVGGQGAMPLFYRNLRIFGNCTVYLEIFGLLQLVKVKVLNFIGKSLNLDSLLYRYHDASGEQRAIAGCFDFGYEPCGPHFITEGAVGSCS